MALTPQDLEAIASIMDGKLADTEGRINNKFDLMRSEIRDVRSEIIRVETSVTAHINDAQRANTRQFNALRPELKENGALPS